MKSQTVTPFFYSEADSSFAESSRCRAFVALAKLALESNRLQEAEELYRCAIGEAEEECGPDSKEVASVLEDMADLYGLLGKTALCLMYRRRARSIV
jgi:hypothetical protein